MKKYLILGILTLIWALFISSVAAYFSIVGLAALFSATVIPIIIMGIALEGGKIISTIFVHQNWKNNNFKFLHRIYLLSAIFATMLLTAIGIFGFLSKGHLDQEQPLVQSEFVIKQYEQEINHLTEKNKLNKTQLDQLDASIDVYFKNDRATQGLVARENQKQQREFLNSEINENNQKILELNSLILTKKLETSDVTAKLGPIKYVAEALGWEDPNIAVRMVIFIIMWSFDPLAIVLVISGIFLLDIYNDKKNIEKDKKITQNDQRIKQSNEKIKIDINDTAHVKINEDYNIDNN